MKDLTTLQLILQVNSKVSNYTGNIEGKYDPSIQTALDKLISHLKTKNKDAESLSIKVNEDGTIDGNISLLASLINAVDKSDLYKVFEKSPYVDFKVVDESALLQAIDKTRIGIKSSFSNSSIDMNELLTAYNKAVDDKDCHELEKAFDIIRTFNDSIQGKSIKTAVELAVKNADIFLKFAASCKNN